MSEKWTSEHLTLFVDAKEEEVLQVIKIEEDKLPFEVVVGNLDISDILLCAKLSEQDVLRVCKQDAETLASKSSAAATQSRKRKHSEVDTTTTTTTAAAVAFSTDVRVEDGDEIESIDSGTSSLSWYGGEAGDEDDVLESGYVYNPVPQLFQQGEKADRIIDKRMIYVPLVAIERKRAEDLGQSITGKSKNDPGFVRYKDQKLRLKAFQRVTGCKLMVAVEEYHTRFVNAKFIGGLSEEGFRSALVHTMLRDGIFVDSSRNFFDTVRLIEKCAKEVLDKQFRNFIFPRLFAAVRRAVANNTLGVPVPSSQDKKRRKEEQQAFDEAVQHLCVSVRNTRERLFNGVYATEKLISSHSQIINIRKKENKDPTLCYQMMLQCVHGVSDKMASAIVRHYPTMPTLFTAYAACPSAKQRQSLLKDIETDTFTPKGKRRKVGPAKSVQIYETLFAVKSSDDHDDDGAAEKKKAKKQKKQKQK